MKYTDRELVILTGKPGSGKSRLGKELGNSRTVEHVSFGDTVRRIARAAISSVYEPDVRRHLAANPYGQLPQDIALEVAYEILERTDGTPTLILDGFPRNLGQVEALDELTYISDRKIIGVIETTVHDEVAMQRLTKRSEREVSPHVARQRLEAYQATQPVLDTLKESYPYAKIETSGSKSIADELGHAALQTFRLGAAPKDLAA